MSDLSDLQDAIDAIDTLKRNYPSSCFEDLCKAVDIAIKALSAQADIDTWRADFKGYVDCLDLPMDDYNGIMEYIDKAPSAQPEPLTDKEQRIFLAAMSREEKVCKEVDEEYRE